MGGLPNPLTGLLLCLGDHRSDRPSQKFLASFPTRLEGDRETDLFPDVVKPLRVVGQGVGEDHTVGNVDEPSGDLVTFDPVTDFHEREPEETDIRDVAVQPSYFDAIAHLERLSGHDVSPSRHVLEKVAKRYGDAGG